MNIMILKDTDTSILFNEPKQIELTKHMLVIDGTEFEIKCLVGIENEFCSPLQSGMVSMIRKLIIELSN